MTDSLSLATTSAADRRQSVSASPVPPYQNHAQLDPSTLDGTVEEDDGEIACICAYQDDDGNTIQCDNCNRWQHILCYYPPPAEVPIGEDQKHFCVDCAHRELDARKATERQRKALEQRNGANGVKRPAAKSHKKKTKDSPSVNAQANGWPTDRHSHIHNHDRKSASPRDQPPPAKRPKTSHRVSNSISQTSGRKRNGTLSHSHHRSPSISPDFVSAPGPVLPLYSDEFLQICQPSSPQVETDTNLMNNIAVTNSLSEWLTDSEAVSQATGGLTQSEIFKRWDSRMEDIPGRPQVSVDYMEDPRFSSDGHTLKWPRLTVEDQIAPGTFIGELRGRIGHRDDYTQDPESRWDSIRHPVPFVFFHPQLPICIDARQEGSTFRFVRRSCQPNAELQTIITEGTEYHFCFMATKDIAPGDEVTIAWQVPDTIHERIKSSLAHSASFQPNVRNYISTWVSKVLADCGPCACNGQSNCLMAHYDRRGLPQPPEIAPLKPTKGRKKKAAQYISPIDTSTINHSRSGSEARKFDHDEDMTDSRSVSGSRGSVSRDITPNTHYSGNASVNGLPEMSERERKKLMREEEMFRRQEEENGRQRKKRNSGGSNLNTPSATTSKQLGQSTHLPYKYADAGTSSSRSNFIKSQSSGKRTSKGGQVPRLAPRESTSAPKGTPSVYADASVQCEIERSPQPRRDDRVQCKYISATNRLLRRCVSNYLKQRDDSPEEIPAVEDSDNAMDVDSHETSTAATALKETVISMDENTTKEDKERASSSPSPTESPGQVDTLMEDAEPETPMKTESPIVTSKSALSQLASSPVVSEDISLPSHPPMEPPPPPWPTQASHESEREPSAEHALPPLQTSIPQINRPEMHVEMPPPHSNPFGAPQPLSSQNTLAQVQSPLALTPGGSQLPTGPLFSPSVTAAVIPSPARKKMSLSDYTKRSKARESEGAASGPGGGNRDSSPATSVTEGPSSSANQAAEAVEEVRAAASEKGVLESLGQENVVVDEDDAAKDIGAEVI